jgi:pimeloyl-ACP methyl ester carboxylesterase
VVPLLEAAGHTAIAVDLPADDDTAGLSVYASTVVEAIGARGDVIVLAQSLGGFTAPLVCARVDVRGLALLNAMIPRPGETAAAWGAATRSAAARAAAARRGGYGDFDAFTYFLHDVPEDVAKASADHDREQSAAAMAEPCRFDAWPAVPTRVLLGRNDRLFPPDFQRRIARERLSRGVIVEVAGGHLAALSNPDAVAEAVLKLA